MESEHNKSTLYERWTKKYRFIIRCNDEHEELWTVVFNKVRLLLISMGGLLVFAMLMYLLFAYTPAKELIPGYDKNLHLQVVRNYFRLDSLESEIQIRDQYFNNINAIVSGNIPADLSVYDSGKVKESDVNLNKSNEDSVLRSILQREDGFDAALSRLRVAHNDITNLHFFPPVKGYVTNSYNSVHSHYGTDIVAQPEEVVKATLDGTVTMATWTIETGYVIQIQHANNIISVYKHNAALWKSPGDYVKAGEAIAIVGNSGELTTGPHLHFELWHNGTPLNAENFVAF